MSAHHKHVYNVEALEAALHLPKGHTISRMWVSDDPLELSVAIEVDGWYGEERKSELHIVPRPQ